MSSSALAAALRRATEALEGGPQEPEACVKMFTVCGEMVERLALFSNNEEVDDVGTTSLKYLLIPMYIGDALQSVVGEGRLASMRRARESYQTFLATAERYGLMFPDSRKAYLREEKPDASTAREEKVARFRREREVAGKLEQLAKSQALKRAMRADLPGDGEGGDGVEGDGEEECDDEDERELWVLRIKLAADKAFGTLSTIDLELEMLELAAAGTIPEPPRPSPWAANQGASQEPPCAISGKVEEELRRRSDRERVRGEIFRPSHALPTMTLKEFADQEVKEAEERSRRQAEAEAAEAARKAEAGSDDEEELAKARRWDEFKDDNPSGWGNSKLRPCA